jgi:DNA-directed RNA polymerase specialized sigma24 family protein
LQKFPGLRHCPLHPSRQLTTIFATLLLIGEKERLALLWRYTENLSTREMAQNAGKTDKAIERLLARAREHFRRRWNHAEP